MSVGALSSDWTIIKKNILRSWPIWVTYLVVLAIIGPVSIWLTYSGNTLYHMYDTICKDMVNQSAFISIIAASVSALVQFSYLRSRKMSYYFHSLPVSRFEMFINGCISGIIILILPNILCFLCGTVQTAAYGLCLCTPLVKWLLIISVEEIFYYMLALLCIMIMGNTITSAVMYLLIFFTSGMLGIFLNYYFSCTVYGYIDNSSRIAENIGRLFLYDKFELNTIYSNEMKTVIDDVKFTNASGILIILGALSLILFLISALLYKKRMSEDSGGIINLKPVRGFITVIFALLFAFSLMYFVMDAVDISPYSLQFVVISTILLSVFSLLGYFVIRMILCKSFRVFRKYIKSGLVLFAAMVAACILVCTDAVGYSTRIPDMEDVARCKMVIFNPYIRKTSFVYGSFDCISQIHKKLTESLSYDKEEREYIYFAYTMKNGSVMQRRYHTAPDESFYDDFYKLYKADWKERMLENYKDAEIIYGSVHSSSDEDDRIIRLNPNDTNVIWNALKQDIKEDRLDVLFATSDFAYEDEYVEFCVVYNSELSYEDFEIVNDSEVSLGAVTDMRELTDGTRVIYFNFSSQCKEAMKALNDVIKKGEWEIDE